MPVGPVGGEKPGAAAGLPGGSPAPWRAGSRRPLALCAALPHNGSVLKLVTVVETEAFARRADKLLTPEERDELVAFLATNPTAGDLIEGTGGVRKVRFAARGKGKSGGARVIHFFLPEDGPLYALLIYAKGEQGELRPEQRKAVTEVAAALKRTAKARRSRR